MTTVNAGSGSFSTSFLNSVNQTASSSSSSSSGSSGSANDLQGSFLKLLVAQMNNQDPLNPMDNSQVTSQLAQISTVSGITQLNTTLSSITSQLSSTQNLQAAALVGKGVLIPGSKVGVSSGTATPFGFTLPSAATNVTLTIKDANGNTVRTVNTGAVDAGTQALTWDGKNDAGSTVADGTYTVAISATNNGTGVTATSLQYAQVQSVVTSASGTPMLNVGTGTNVAMSSVAEIL
jgi:flagellar basal-body rod modification protein FlgD